MEWNEKETIILNLVNYVFQEIINNHPILPIRAKSRAGAEISDFLEDQFVNLVKNNPSIIEVAGSPKNKTKNPYDVYFIYEFSPNDRELVWIDIKATNAQYDDSNPDMGTYKKFIKFFKEGNYFVLYCQLAYLPQGEELRFVETPQGKMIHIFLLKDIHHSFRIQPNNQLQVNYALPPEPRTLIDFINLLEQKIQQSLERQRKKVENEMKNLQSDFSEIKQIVRNTLSR